MLTSSYISPKAVKGGPSMIEGRGLAAVAPIAKDEIVAIKGGHIVDTATLHSLPERLRNSDVQIADGFTWLPWRRRSMSRPRCFATTRANRTWALRATSCWWPCVRSTLARS